MRARRVPREGAHSMSLEEKGSRSLQTAEAGTISRVRHLCTRLPRAPRELIRP